MPVVETKTCRISGEKFSITEDDLRFYDSVSPVFDGRKFAIPTPQLCPDQRMRRRMSFRNFMNLYGRKSSFSGKTILSMYRPDTNLTVFSNDEWWSDSWNQFAQGLVFDDTATLNDQLLKLHESTPRMGLMRTRCENCDYVNLAVESKNCYLVFGCLRDEDCIYGHIIWRSIKCIDCLYIYNCENLYQCIDCVDCQNLFFSSGCQDCSYGYFLDHCVGCQDCFGCVGLHHKRYYIFNQPHSKEQYEKKVAELQSFSPEVQSAVHTKMDTLRAQVPQCYIHTKNSENVSGDYIHYSTNAFESYDLKNCENVRFCATLDGFTNSYDCMFSAGPADHSYENIFAYGSNLLFNHDSTNENSHLIYCTTCHSCQDCFGCANLKKANHCVLNKPMSKQEYEKTCAKIIDHMISTGEWGEFFEPRISPFGYNESIASQYFPSTKQEITDLGWNWVDREEKDYIGPVYRLKQIDQYDERKVGREKAQQNIDACLEGICLCEVTKRPYKIIRQELAFYIEHGLPLPRRHPETRHMDRMALRNPRKLYTRSCQECGTLLSTTYSPERIEKVVCENCYHKLVY